MAQAAQVNNAIRGAIDNSSPELDGSKLEKQFQARSEGSEAPSNEVRIPASDDRDDLPKILVEKFEFDRIPEFPESGITKSAVKSIVENKRRSLMKVDEVFASGYTRAELEELAATLERVKARESKGLDESALRQLTDVIKQQNAARGLSYYDIEDVAALVTQFYRSNGLFLAKAYIPAQDVQNGVVKLGIMEGVLGELSVTGNQSYSEERLKQPLIDQVGLLVNDKDIEEAFYLLNDYPGLSIYGGFEAGSRPSETKLNINVREEQKWQLAIRADNHGSTFTGDNRLYAVADLYNLTGNGDELSIGYLKSFSPLNSDLGQIHYSYPVFDARTRINVGADYNEFTVENENSDRYDITGKNSLYQLGISRKMLRTRAKNFTLSANLTDKKTELESEIDLLTNAGDHTVGADLGFSFDVMGNTFPMLNMIDLSVQYGKITNDVPVTRDDEFYKFRMATNSLFFLPIPFSDLKSRLIVRSFGQYSESSLPAYEQSSLGGGAAVRAFTVSDFSADSSAYIATEWYPDIPDLINFSVYGDKQLKDLFEFGIFLEGAYGSQNVYAVDTADDWAKMSGYGMLLKFHAGESFNSQISIARPLSIESSVEGVGLDQKSIRTFVDFTFYFK
ncbi:ShlB/FhaC/HecB family hemolysin secretion/activation protein [Sinobacterium caligoides]|uniref:ShlB/FhaC/HecB family hemolysin secretion/activation protein n=1 Tax=Sinobacterium caligoides TaxID=933926 RepID=UPI0011CE1375|nr:ShlB/FhaC/HecB family hemolysin secretion/activation protein [Sinobacterium caligoides]